MLHFAPGGLLVHGANPGGSVQSKQHRSAGLSVRAMAESCGLWDELLSKWLGILGDGCHMLKPATMISAAKALWIGIFRDYEQLIEPVAFECH